MRRTSRPSPTRSPLRPRRDVRAAKPSHIDPFILRNHPREPRPWFTPDSSLRFGMPDGPLRAALSAPAWGWLRSLRSPRSPQAQPSQAPASPASRLCDLPGTPRCSRWPHVGLRARRGVAPLRPVGPYALATSRSAAQRLRPAGEPPPSRTRVEPLKKTGSTRNASSRTRKADEPYPIRTRLLRSRAPKGFIYRVRGVALHRWMPGGWRGAACRPGPAGAVTKPRASTLSGTVDAGSGVAVGIEAEPRSA